MRFIRWFAIAGSLLLAIPSVSMASYPRNNPELNVLSLELMGTTPDGETVPRAHFFIEPETGVWGAAGDWAYWEPEGGWYLRRDAAGIYRVWLLTGQEQKLTKIPQDAKITRAAVSPDSQWVAFATINEQYRFAAYAVRSDGREQRLLMHGHIAERVWSFGWSEDGQSVEFDLQPIYYKTTRFSVRLDGSAIRSDGAWYNVSLDSKWMTWQVQGFNYYSYVLRLDTGQTRKLPDEVAMSPLWSPDSQWLLYIAGKGNSKAIYRERPDGSDVQIITQWSADYSRMWSGPKDEWLYIVESSKKLYRVRFDQLGSDLQLVTDLPGGLWTRQGVPESVRGGPWLYFINTYERSADIYRLHLESGEVQNLTDHSAAYSFLFWSPEGIPGGPWLYFMSDRDSEQTGGDAIFRMKPDGAELKRLTDPVVEPGSWGTTPKTAIQWSADSQWLEFGIGRSPNCQMRPDGSDLLCLPLPFYETTALPNGQWVVFAHTTKAPETSNIYGLRQDNKGGLINLTGRTDNATYRYLTWAPNYVPDGPWVYFESDLSGDWELYRLQPDSQKLENLTRNPGKDTFLDLYDNGLTSRISRIWSPEGVTGGPWLYFLSDRAGGFNLYRIQPDGSQLEKLTPTPEKRLYVEWSPDDRWLVFWASDQLNPVDGFRMRPDGSKLQQTIWFSGLHKPGTAVLREETPLADDRWILEQEIDLTDCASWTVRLRAANSSTARTTINIGAYIASGEPCYVLRNILNIGSQYLDGSHPPGERVVWLPMVVDRR